MKKKVAVMLCIFLLLLPIVYAADDMPPLPSLPDDSKPEPPKPQANISKAPVDTTKQASQSNTPRTPVAEPDKTQQIPKDSSSANDDSLREGMFGLSSTNLFLAAILAFNFLILLLVIIILIRMGSSGRQSGKDDSYEKIVEYVQYYVSKGYDSSTIKDFLLKKGYPNSTVDKAFEQVYSKLMGK